MSWIIYLIVVMIITFIFFKKKRFKTNVKIEKIPSHWHDVLVDKVRFYEKLSFTKQIYFKSRMKAFLNRVNIEAIGFELEELDIVLVAASGIIPIFNFKNWNYPNLDTVLIYPDYFNENLSFNKEESDRNIGGLVGTGQFSNQMILSKKALYHGFSNKTDKGNTGVHEFVHLLDMLDGKIDGVPERLLKEKNVIPWLDLMYKKMEAINSNTSDIRKYGGTSEEEFFAVASEYFFERPKLLKRKHPQLYKMLSSCFETKE